MLFRNTHTKKHGIFSQFQFGGYVDRVVLVRAVGDIVQHRFCEYELLSIEPYTRKDGAQTDLFAWRTSCRGCKRDVRFKTGRSGTFPIFCKPCLIEMDTEARRKARSEQAVENIPSLRLIHTAMTAAYPCQMSLAENAPRRIYAPLILRNACPELANYTLAEIKIGITNGCAANMLKMVMVGRRKSGHALKGYWARPAETCIKYGLFEDDPAPFTPKPGRLFE